MRRWCVGGLQILEPCVGGAQVVRRWCVGGLQIPEPLRRRCYAVFDDLSRHLCTSRWSSPLSYCDWTMHMRHWPVFRPACLTVSSPSSTRQRSRLPVSVVRSILQMLSPVSTGSERPSASSSNWPSSSTELFMHCT